MSEAKNYNIPVEVQCIDCGTKFIISRSGYNARKRTDGDNPKFRCSECNRKYRSEKKRREMAEMDPEKKKAMYKKVSKGRKEFLANLSTEEKDAMMNNINQGRTQWLENISPEEKERISKAHSESNRRRWENTTDEQRQIISEEAKERWRNKPQEEKDSHAQHSRDMWANRSEEEIAITKQKMSYNKKLFWKNITPEQRQVLSAKIGKSVKLIWEQMTDEERMQVSKSHQEYWNSLSDEERDIFAKSRLKDNKYNNFNKTFENDFHRSSISNEFEIVGERKTINQNFDHTWDYIIYEKSTRKPVMVIDLDGSFIHANNIDYDGNFSKEEYDECRYMAIPDNMKFMFINDFKYEEDFNNMEKYLYISYEQFIQIRKKQFSVIPFPYPSFTIIQLMKSYRFLERMKTDDKYHKDISINTCNGNIISFHFHHSIWHDMNLEYNSPYDDWKNDDIRNDLIDKKVIYQNVNNKNKILQGFNRSRVSVFSAGRAKMIIARYLSEFDTVFDPFSSYSGRMLGTIVSRKRYIGQDLSERHVRESNEIISFLHKYAVQFDAEIFQRDILESSGKYQCLFTCPPYADEEYEDVPFDARSCDDWIDECLKRFDCKRYVFVVNTTQRYQDYVVETLNNKSIFGIQKEYIIIINANRES